MKKQIEKYLKEIRDYRNDAYSMDLRNYSFEDGFDKGFIEGAIWTVTQLHLMHEKKAYLNDQMFLGASAVFEEAEDLIDHRQELFKETK